MARAFSRGRPHSRTGVVLSAVGVTALAIGVIALSVLAYERARPSVSADIPAPVRTHDTDALSTPTATPTPTPTVEAAPGAAERFLTVGAEAMWRGVAGSCDTATPLIEWSDDDGQTWSDVTPTYRNVGQLRALTSFGGVNATAVADTTDACAATALSSFTSGEFWEPYPDVFETASYASSAAGTVVIDGDPVAAPCAIPWGVRTGDADALICDGGAYVLSGSAWGLVTRAARAVAVGPDGVVVAHIADACGGLQLTRYSDGAATELGCLTDVELSEPVAIDIDGADVVVWAGDTLTRW